ncbi:hypothetical protein ACHWQZ_G001403 [Mnemiopsis leidyi]
MVVSAKSSELIQLLNENQVFTDSDQENIFLMLPSISSLLSDIELEGTDLFAGEGYTEEHKKGEEEKLKEDQQPQASQKSEHVRERLQECMREFEISRSSADGSDDWPASSGVFSDCNPEMFRTVFPYSGDVLYAQLYPAHENDTESGSSKGARKLFLWQFLLQLIRDPNESCIKWTGRPPEFILTDPQQVAKMWSEYKGRGHINVESLCRALRYYYSRNILKRRQGMGRFVYSFSEAALEQGDANTT